MADRGPKTKKGKPTWDKAGNAHIRVIDGDNRGAPDWLTNRDALDRYSKLSTMYGDIVDPDTLAVASAHFGRVIDAEKMIEQHGAIMDDCKGSIKKSPYIQIMKDNSKAYHDYIKSFDALLEKNPGNGKNEDKPKGAAAYMGGARNGHKDQRNI